MESYTVCTALSSLARESTLWRIHCVYTTPSLITWQVARLPDPVPQYHSAHVQVTLMLPNNGPRAQE